MQHGRTQVLRCTKPWQLASLAFWPLAVAVIALLLLPFGARAEDEPSGRVGRVADAGGQLFLAPEDRANEWEPIGLNYPITSGDNLWVSGDGRAEVDFGAGQFRLAGDTNVHVSRLDDRELSLFIAQGRAIVRIRVLDADESARIDTPNTQVLLARPGLYRIDVSNDRQETTVVVREGEASVAVTGGAQQILPGQTATLFGTGDVQADVRNGTGIDGFDSWSANRDLVYMRSRSATYVSRQMVGYADLDDHGTWQSYPEYGAVWFPTTVAVDWAPYRYGRWVSLPTWGWTWVDDAPWGYAPFHYGRWSFIGGRWGWCPGTFVARPVWAPAFVAWYGGSGWGVSAGGGPVYGWVPLGWRDPYIPSWRNCTSRCWAAYNRPYAVNVAERPRQPPTYYANRNVPGAITAVAGATFAAGKPVAPNVVPIAGHLAANAPISSSAPPLKPLPVAINAVRPGNGVPAPASTLQSITKPMLVAPGRDAVGPASPRGPVGRGQPYGQPLSVPPAPGGAITAVPPAAKPASAYDGAEAPQRYARPATNAPAAVPPGPASLNSAPPARLRPQPPQEGQSVAPQAIRRERAPQPGYPLPQSMQAPLRPAPQGVPVAPSQAIQAVPPQAMRGAPPPQALPAMPPAPPQAPHAIERPVAAKPPASAN